jgi:predicted RNase H-like nuclease (RuvC/YqgF family)
MPDPVTLGLAAIGTASILYGTFNGVLRLVKRISLWRDSRRIKRDTERFAIQQAAWAKAREQLSEIEIYKDRIKQLEEKNQDLLDEVQRLIRRCIKMSNELRSDPKAPTEVLQAPSSARFARGL